MFTEKAVNMPLVPSTFPGLCVYAGMNMSNQRLRDKFKSKPVTCFVRRRQLLLYGHMAHLQDISPIQRVIFCCRQP